MKKLHRIAVKSTLESMNSGQITAATALRRIYNIFETIEEEKLDAIKSERYVSRLISTTPRYTGLGGCTMRVAPALI